MKRYRVAFCKGRDCRAGGADALFQQARAGVEARGLAARCEVYRGGCYGLCHQGPNVVVREETGGARLDPFSREDFQLTGAPGEAHYPAMTHEGVERLVAEHLEEGRPVAELLRRPRPPSRTGTG